MVGYATTHLTSVPVAVWGQRSDTVVVGVHGMSSSKDDPIFSTLAQVAERHGAQTVSFDLPGHGERTSSKRPEELMPWDAIGDIEAVLDWAARHWNRIYLFAVSIGAYFSLIAAQGQPIERSWFVSPLLDMQATIESSMRMSGISEEQLRSQGTVQTPGMTLSYEYLTWVREHPVTVWPEGTHILRAHDDNVVPLGQIEDFVQHHEAILTMAADGEHWFHTNIQLSTLSDWLVDTWPSGSTGTQG